MTFEKSIGFESQTSNLEQSGGYPKYGFSYRSGNVGQRKDFRLEIKDKKPQFQFLERFQCTRNA
eukprot:3935249-Rhodomonas_salina.4